MDQSSVNCTIGIAGSTVSPKRATAILTTLAMTGERRSTLFSTGMARYQAQISGVSLMRKAPWYEARQLEGLMPFERGDAKITLDSIAEYYGGLYDDAEEI